MWLAVEEAMTGETVGWPAHHRTLGIGFPCQGIDDIDEGMLAGFWTSFPLHLDGPKKSYCSIRGDRVNDADWMTNLGGF